MASLLNNYNDIFSEGAPTGKKKIILLTFPHILPALSGKIAHIKEAHINIV